MLESKFVTVFETRYKRRSVKIQREESLDGETVCFCVQYGGGGKYFSTEAECFAYAYGRGFIERWQNPWVFGGAKCINKDAEKPA